MGTALMLIGLLVLVVALTALSSSQRRRAGSRSRNSAVNAAIACVAVLGIGVAISSRYQSVTAPADQAHSGTPSAPTTTVARAPATTTAPGSKAAVADAPVWDSLAHCESGGNWASNTGNGLFGGVQLDQGAWLSYGGAAYAPLPSDATRGQQILVAEKVRKSRGGFSAWSFCASKLGLR